jgi:hypothetical protein
MLLQAAKRSIENIYDFIHTRTFLTVDSADGPGLLLKSAPRRRVWANNMPWAYSTPDVIAWMFQGASKTRFLKYFGSGTYFM